MSEMVSLFPEVQPARPPADKPAPVSTLPYWGMEQYPGETAPLMCRDTCFVSHECLLHADSGTKPTAETTYPFGRSRHQCGYYIPARYRGAQVIAPSTPSRRRKRGA